ncbi:unnamed protein product [Owenia fusiformis]|uniref:Uncharacterized protein n=1 Tax=Owenia fusiformis TaxID=6347 RepID=A0A8S4N0Z2_OWEFU|nr:unnamed protein product [Owenia fusiformis]
MRVLFAILLFSVGGQSLFFHRNNADLTDLYNEMRQLQTERRFLKPIKVVGNVIDSFFGKKPTTQLATEPTTPLVTEATSRLPAEPTTQLPAEPTTQLPAEPTTQLPAEPTTQLPAEPTTQLSAEPTTQLPAEPTTQLPAEPTTQLPAEPTTQLPAEPTTQLPAEPTAQLPAKIKLKKLSYAANLLSPYIDNNLFFQSNISASPQRINVCLDVAPQSLNQLQPLPTACQSVMLDEVIQKLFQYWAYSEDSFILTNTIFSILRNAHQTPEGRVPEVLLLRAAKNLAGIIQGETLKKIAEEWTIQKETINYDGCISVSEELNFISSIVPTLKIKEDEFNELYKIMSKGFTNGIEDEEIAAVIEGLIEELVLLSPEYFKLVNRRLDQLAKLDSENGYQKLLDYVLKVKDPAIIGKMEYVLLTRLGEEIGQHLDLLKLFFYPPVPPTTPETEVTTVTMPPPPSTTTVETTTVILGPDETTPSTTQALLFSTESTTTEEGQTTVPVTPRPKTTTQASLCPDNSDMFPRLVSKIVRYVSESTIQKAANWSKAALLGNEALNSLEDLTAKQIIDLDVEIVNGIQEDLLVNEDAFIKKVEQIQQDCLPLEEVLPAVKQAMSNTLRMPGDRVDKFVADIKAVLVSKLMSEEIVESYRPHLVTFLETINLSYLKLMQALQSLDAFASYVSANADNNLLSALLPTELYSYFFNDLQNYINQNLASPLDGRLTAKLNDLVKAILPSGGKASQNNGLDSELEELLNGPSSELLARLLRHSSRK